MLGDLGSDGANDIGFCCLCFCDCLLPHGYLKCSLALLSVTGSCSSCKPGYEGALGSQAISECGTEFRESVVPQAKLWAKRINYNFILML